MENNDWKKEAPTLAGLERKNPFSIPEGYFNTLQEQLNSRTYIESIYPEKFESKFTVPEGYFNDLTAQIEGRIITESFKEQFVGNSFTVPEGYFSTLQDRINEKVAEPVKVISIRSRRVTAWISYAAAACVMIAVSAGLYFNTLNPITNSAGISATTNVPDLSSISSEGIVDYLQKNSTRADMPAIKEIIGDNAVSFTIDEEIQTEDLQEYLNNNL